MIDPNTFLTLSKRGAQNRAESLNLVFRLIRIDQEHFLDYPEDTRDDRVCVELDNGAVSVAAIR